MSTSSVYLARSWPIFLEVIRMRRTISYSELAGRMGTPLHHRHIHRQFLAPLSHGCQYAILPDLASLVVRKDSGLPGQGWFTPYLDIDPEQHWAEIVETCFHHRWSKQPPARLITAMEIALPP